MTPQVSNLAYFVLCKSTQAFFETIAGFDCKPPALDYLQNCRERQDPKPSADRFTYRLVDAQGREVR